MKRISAWARRSAKWTWDEGEVTGQAPQSPPSMTPGSCDTNALKNLLLKHIVYLIYIYMYIHTHIALPPLHTAVTWLPILLGFCSLMCSTLLQRYPSVATGDERMEWEGYSTQGKERKRNPRNSWAPLKTNLHANTACVPPKTESNSKIVASFQPP